MQRHSRVGPAPVLALLTLAALAIAQESPKPAAERPAHPVVLWTFDDDLLRPDYLALVREAGADAVQSRRGHGLDAIRAAGLSWYEDHAVGKGVLALRKSDADPVWEEFWRDREVAWPSERVRSRPVSWHDPIVRAELRDRTRAAARRGADAALAVVLEDEPGIGIRSNPTDWDLSDARVEVFREWMRARVPVLAALNERWGTEYADWAEVRPWTTAAIRARELPRDPDAWNLAPWMDTREFQDEDFAAVVSELVEVSQKEAEGLPVGLAGLQAPSAFGGYDYERLAPTCTFLEPYDIGLAMPICADLARPGSVIAQTVFPSPDDGHRRGIWRFWMGVLRGAELSIVWSSHDAVTREGMEPTGYLRALTAEFAVLRRVAPAIAGSEPLDQGVRILLSQPSVRVRWMRDSVVDGNTWPRRFGSYEAQHSTAITQREAAWGALVRHEAGFIGTRQLAAGLSDDVKLLVLPDALALSDAEIASVRAAVEAGTTVVLDGEAGRYDEAGRARDEPALCAGEGIVVDPGFHRLGPLAAELIDGPVEVVAYRTGTEERVDVELRHRVLGDRRLLVAAPRWQARVRADGSSEGAIPDGEWTLVVRPRSKRVTEARDLGQDRALTGERWVLTAPTARAIVVRWRE